MLSVGIGLDYWITDQTGRYIPLGMNSKKSIV